MSLYEAMSVCGAESKSTHMQPGLTVQVQDAPLQGTECEP